MTEDNTPMVLQELAAIFDGIGMEEKANLSAILATVDSEGWPHLSFLSVGEILFRDDRVLLMLWKHSRSAGALQDKSRAALFASAAGIVFELRLADVETEISSDGRSMIAISTIENVRRHEAPYAKVDSLITFTLLDKPATFGRWRGQLADLEKAFST